ncbi:hypothetical protein GDO78_020669 [Eleutherodactylus coqui]|uniref:Uncharacterized protein n=1 Tax=Eleutherodactylus coqui TaxID=57060 RepID=A0A8J6C5Q6_ELECQ|nr:hypothetical protein GDO78_020669 [Eleutherodactylus coqui]
MWICFANLLVRKTNRSMLHFYVDPVLTASIEVNGSRPIAAHQQLTLQKCRGFRGESSGLNKKKKTTYCASAPAPQNTSAVQKKRSGRDTGDPHRPRTGKRMFSAAGRVGFRCGLLPTEFDPPVDMGP